VVGVGKGLAGDATLQMLRPYTARGPGAWVRTRRHILLGSSCGGRRAGRRWTQSPRGETGQQRAAEAKEYKAKNFKHAAVVGNFPQG